MSANQDRSLNTCFGGSELQLAMTTAIEPVTISVDSLTANTYRKQPGNTDTYTYSSVQIDQKIAASGGGSGSSQPLNVTNGAFPLSSDLDFSHQSHQILLPPASAIYNPIHAVRYDECQNLINTAISNIPPAPSSGITQAYADSHYVNLSTSLDKQTAPIGNLDMHGNCIIGANTLDQPLSLTNVFYVGNLITDTRSWVASNYLENTPTSTATSAAISAATAIAGSLLGATASLVLGTASQSLTGISSAVTSILASTAITAGENVAADILQGAKGQILPDGSELSSAASSTMQRPPTASTYDNQLDFSKNDELFMQDKQANLNDYYDYVKNSEVSLGDIQLKPETTVSSGMRYQEGLYTRNIGGLNDKLITLAQKQPELLPTTAFQDRLAEVATQNAKYAEPMFSSRGVNTGIRYPDGTTFTFDQPLLIEPAPLQHGIIEELVTVKRIQEPFTDVEPQKYVTFITPQQTNFNELADPHSAVSCLSLLNWADSCVINHLSSHQNELQQHQTSIDGVVADIQQIKTDYITSIDASDTYATIANLNSEASARVATQQNHSNQITALQNRRLDQWKPPTTDIDMATNSLTNLRQPAQNNDACTKFYTDSQIQNEIQRSSTITDQLQTAIDTEITNRTISDSQIISTPLNQIAVPIAALSLNNQRITSLATAVSSTDAISMGQSQSLFATQSQLNGEAATRASAITNLQNQVNVLPTITSMNTAISVETVRAKAAETSISANFMPYQSSNHAILTSSVLQQLSSTGQPISNAPFITANSGEITITGGELCIPPGTVQSDIWGDRQYVTLGYVSTFTYPRSGIDYQVNTLQTQINTLNTEVQNNTFVSNPTTQLYATTKNIELTNTAGQPNGVTITDVQTNIVGDLVYASGNLDLTTLSESARASFITSASFIDSRIDSEQTRAIVAEQQEITNRTAAIATLQSQVNTLPTATINDGKYYKNTTTLDQILAATSSINCNSQLLRSVLDPILPQDAATMHYTQQQIAPLATTVSVTSSIQTETTARTAADTTETNARIAAINAIPAQTSSQISTALVPYQTKVLNDAQYISTATGNTLYRSINSPFSSIISSDLNTSVSCGNANNGISIVANTYQVGTIGRQVGSANNTDMLLNATTKLSINSTSGSINLATNSTATGNNVYVTSNDIATTNHQDQICLGAGGGKQLLTLSTGHVLVNGTQVQYSSLSNQSGATQFNLQLSPGTPQMDNTFTMYANSYVSLFPILTLFSGRAGYSSSAIVPLSITSTEFSTVAYVNQQIAAQTTTIAPQIRTISGSSLLISDIALNLTFNGASSAALSITQPVSGTSGNTVNSYNGKLHTNQLICAANATPQYQFSSSGTITTIPFLITLQANKLQFGTTANSVTIQDGNVMPYQFGAQAGYSTIPISNVQPGSFLCQNQLSQPNFMGGAIIDSSNILFDNSIIESNGGFIRHNYNGNGAIPYTTTDCITYQQLPSACGQSFIRPIWYSLSWNGGAIGTQNPTSTYTLATSCVLISSYGPSVTSMFLAIGLVNKSNFCGSLVLTAQTGVNLGLYAFVPIVKSVQTATVPPSDYSNFVTVIVQRPSNTQVVFTVSQSGGISNNLFFLDFQMTLL